MCNVCFPITVLQPAQSITIGGSGGAGSSVRKFISGIESIPSPGMMHLSHRTSFDGAIIFCIIGWPCRKMKCHIVGELINGRNHSAHGTPASVFCIMQQCFFIPFFIQPAIAVCKFVRSNISILIRCSFHSKGFKNIFLNVFLVLHSRYSCNDFSQQSKTKIAVFISNAGRIRKRDLFTNEIHQVFIRISQLAVTPGIIFGKASTMCHQVPYGNMRGIGCRVF